MHRNSTRTHLTAITICSKIYLDMKEEVNDEGCRGFCWADIYLVWYRPPEGLSIGWWPVCYVVRCPGYQTVTTILHLADGPTPYSYNVIHFVEPHFIYFVLVFLCFKNVNFSCTHASFYKRWMKKIIFISKKTLCVISKNPVVCIPTQALILIIGL